MEFRRCQAPWARFIAHDDPHCKCVKCLGFSHARNAVYGILKCRFCENLRLITLRSRLEVCEKESSIFPRRALEASAASREPATWGSDVELEEMGRRASPFLSHPHPISGMSSLARHSASSIAFHSRMGVSTGGIAVGSPYNSVWLHTSVWEKSPPLQRGSADSSKQCLQGFCSTTRTLLPPTERSDRGNTSVGHRTRVFQPLLPCSKERRRSEAHSGSAASEFFPLQREVQDADDENHHVSDSRRGLVCHYRTKGCVFSHPGRSATQEVPSVCLWREGLPIQGPALWRRERSQNAWMLHWPL